MLNFNDGHFMFNSIRKQTCIKLINYIQIQFQVDRCIKTTLICLIKLLFYFVPIISFKFILI